MIFKITGGILFGFMLGFYTALLIPSEKEILCKNYGYLEERTDAIQGYIETNCLN